MTVSRFSQASLSTPTKYRNLMAGQSIGDYELITTTALGSAQASVTFSTANLSQYKHLQIRITSRTSSTADYEEVKFRFNGDSGSNYNGHYLFGTGTQALSGAMGNAIQGYGYFTTAANAAANYFGSAVMDILDFNSTTKNKTVRTLSGNQYIVLASGLWMSTAAVTSITLLAGGNLVAGSRFSLYGLRG